MDDGSHDTETSLRMMELAFSSGVSDMAATPHFYPDRESPRDFLRRRENAASRLAEKYNASTCPNIYLGAETAFFHGISRSKELRELCFAGTQYILIEMPFTRWSDSVIGELLYVRDNCGVVPVIAHIERYISAQPKGILPFLVRSGVLIQSNAEAFLRIATRRRMLRAASAGLIHLLGSDCHNMRDRLPNLREGAAVVRAHDEEAMMFIEHCGDGIVRAAEPYLRSSGKE
ncbi:MAG: capsular polysaccharide biosynthesis protein [Oscillospiraceae bacterium]|nr:capsular polysaccharide biosynthesis protein [Oscillospiraceae bacterium]